MSGLLGFRYLYPCSEDMLGESKADMHDEYTDNINHQRSVQEHVKVIWNKITMVLKETNKKQYINISKKKMIMLIQSTKYYQHRTKLTAWLTAVILKVQPCKLCNNKDVIASTQITNIEIFAFIHFAFSICMTVPLRGEIVSIIKLIIRHKFFAVFRLSSFTKFHDFGNKLDLKTILYLLLKPTNYCRKAIPHKYLQEYWIRLYSEP